MRDPSINGEAKVEAKDKNRSSADRLDQAGQSILRLLQKADGVVEESNRHAMQAEQNLSQHLRAAEDPIAALESEVEAHRDRAARAEQWLRKVCLEIEDRFLREK